MGKNQEYPERGFFFDRTKDPQCAREKAFAEQWQDDASPGGYWGEPLVQGLLRNQPKSPVGLFVGTPIEAITVRDRKIVATFIQWLGSNVGWCFLEQALKRAGYKIVPIEKR